MFIFYLPINNYHFIVYHLRRYTIPIQKMLLSFSVFTTYLHDGITTTVHRLNKTQHASYPRRGPAAAAAALSSRPLIINTNAVYELPHAHHNSNQRAVVAVAAAARSSSLAPSRGRAGRRFGRRVTVTWSARDNRAKRRQNPGVRRSGSSPCRTARARLSRPDPRPCGFTPLVFFFFLSLGRTITSFTAFGFRKTPRTVAERAQSKYHARVKT